MDGYERSESLNTALASRNEVPGFPRQYARTRRFRLGAPRGFTIAPDGDRILFLRSRSGDDPTMRLWIFDNGAERLLVDSADLLDGAEELTAEERIRRERARDQTVGITGYATDRDVRHAVFAVSGRLWLTDLDGGVRELPARGPVADPRLRPDGSAVAYVSGGALRMINSDGTGDREVIGPDGPEVGYGLPEHVAQESMHRDRGYWWAPAGDRLLVARVDLARVQRWYLADPANPAAPPVEMAYPVVGTANADVSLWLIGERGRVEVDWDRKAFEYLVDVHWSDELLIVVLDRTQRTMRVLAVDPDTGATTLRREDTDPCWVEIVPGTPALTGSGALVWVADVDDSRRLLIDDRPVTPDGLNVREVLDVDGETVLFAASTEPMETHLWTYTVDGGLTRVTEQSGVHSGRRVGGTTVVVANSLEHVGPRVTVHRPGGSVEKIASLVETPVIEPKVELFLAGELELRAAILFPAGHVPGSKKLPVLLDPYGGPAAQRVLAARGQYLVSQWFADQGFAVLVVDGRGTPGRGPAWDKTTYGDRATLPLEDQVIGLHAAAERYPDLDLGRVGMRGWSYSGYLAAQAVLRRPDVFHVAVAGAPVTDMALYDGCYNERYLGLIDEVPNHYEKCNLIPDAPNLRRPLMLIHGLADDNVVAAHTLRLSSALLAAGRPHTVIPLTGDTHMVHNQAAAENLLRIELDFLTKALG
jgi:dipeptidyl-peptidase-4